MTHRIHDSDAVRKTLAVLFAVLMTTSLAVGAVSGAVVGAGAAAGADAGAVDGAQSGAPEGMVGLPSDNIGSDLPRQTPMGQAAADLEAAGIYASDNASSLEAIVTSPGRAKQYVDDDGAAINGGGPLALVLTDDEHHAGREVAVPADELREIMGHQPEAVYGTHESGEQWARPVESDGDYLVFEVPHFSTQTVTFEGEVSLTGSPATDGTTFSYDIADGESVGEVSATLTGTVAERRATNSGREAGQVSTTVDVAGSMDPTGPVDDSPALTVGLDNETQYDTSHIAMVDGGTTQWVNYTVPAPQDHISEFETQIAFMYDDGRSTDYWSDNDMDVYLEGEHMGNAPWMADGDWMTSDIDMDVSEQDEVTVSIWNENTGSSAKQMGSYQTVLKDSDPPESADVSLGGTNTTVSDGSTVPVSLSTGTQTLSVDAPAHIDYSLEWDERAPTTDPVVEVNGETASYSGTLAAGETAELDLSSDAVREGTNHVNVTTGEAGGLQTVVGLSYSHPATADQTVEYEGETWSESYNVSHTFHDSRNTATLTIPFDSSRVVDVRDVEVRRNGSEWTDPESIDMDGTTLNAVVGAVDGGETVEVRAVGSKVDVREGAIEVTDPTVEGAELDTTFEVVDDAGGAPVAIDVGGTASGDRLHYLTGADWSPDDHVLAGADGSQVLELPNAAQGAEGTVGTAPLEVDPETGDAMVTLDSATEPRFTIAPGSTSGDVVHVTWHDATTGEDYQLFDVGGERVVDRGTANSPVTLSTNDEESTYVIEEAEGSGGAGGVGGVTESGGGAGVAPVLLLAVAVAGVLVTLVVANRLGWGRWPVGVVATLAAFGVAELATSASLVGTLSGDLLHGSGQAIMAVTVGPAILLGLWLVNTRWDRGVPNWIMGVAAAGVVLWMFETMAPGVFTDPLRAALDDVAPLIVISGLVGGAWFLRRYLQARRSPDTEVTLSLGDRGGGGQ